MRRDLSTCSWLGAGCRKSLYDHYRARERCPERVRVSIGRQLKIVLRQCHISGLQAVVTRFHGFDENSGNGAAQDAGLFYVFFMGSGIAKIDDLLPRVVEGIGEVRGELAKGGEPCGNVVGEIVLLGEFFILVLFTFANGLLTCKGSGGLAEWRDVGELIETGSGLAVFPPGRIEVAGLFEGMSACERSRLLLGDEIVVACFKVLFHPD